MRERGNSAWMSDADARHKMQLPRRCGSDIYATILCLPETVLTILSSGLDELLLPVAILGRSLKRYRRGLLLSLTKRFNNKKINLLKDKFVPNTLTCEKRLALGKVIILTSGFALLSA